jgi:hypothetical protein
LTSFSCKNSESQWCLVDMGDVQRVLYHG